MYKDIINTVFLKKGDIGFLTIDESRAIQGKPHRGARAQHDRAIHTEAGIRSAGQFGWGDDDHGWGDTEQVRLARNVKILLANNMDNTCAWWDAEHEDTTRDGDIGHAANQYPYEDAIFMQAGEVHKIGILTPHESLPVDRDCERQFLRIVSAGVTGREPYFTQNPLVPLH